MLAAISARHAARDGCSRAGGGSMTVTHGQGRREAWRKRRVVLVAIAAVAMLTGALAPAVAVDVLPPIGGGPVTVAAPRTTPTSAIGRWGDFAPPADATITVSQPDGSTFAAELTGAEIGG